MSIVFRPAKADPKPTRIRWMIRRDMPEALAIEADSRDPWGEDRILGLLRDRYIIGMVAERGESVVGYMIYRMHKSRIHLERVGVHPGHRRSGVFRALCKKLASKLDPARRVSVTAVVDERNLDLLLSMRSCGWTAFEVIPGHFDDADGIHMVMALGSAHA